MAWTVHLSSSDLPRESQCIVPRFLLLSQPAPEGEVDLPVAVDVEGSDADVVALGLIFNDDPPLPVGVLIPDDAVFEGDGDNIGFLVAVDVGDRHGVADFTDLGINLAGFELREFGPCGRIRLSKRLMS